MKKLPIYLLSLSLLASCENVSDLEGASVGESVSQGAEVLESLEETSVFVVELLQNGEFAQVVDYFDENLSQGLEATALEGAWESTVSPLGADLGGISVEIDGNIVVVTAEYEVENLLITLQFGEGSQISGIHLNYAPPSVAVTESQLFVEEEITIGDTSPLGGFLTVPVGVEAPPVVLLVQGSGSTDRNSNIYGNVPFQDIAHGLAEEGIASLRYDRRFYTYPAEAQALALDISLEDEILEDVAMALSFLEQEDRLGDIYVLGHSLGGMLTPSIATTHSIVKGIISMAGSPQPLYEISYAQNKESEAYILENVTDKEQLEIFSAQMAQVEEDILILRGDFSHLPRETVLMGLPVVYQQSVKDHAGVNFLEHLSIPILVLQGSEDFQVSPVEDYGLYLDLLGNRENVTFRLYEGLNHLMMESQVRDVSDYQVKKAVEPVVIEDIVAFIEGQEK